MTLHVPDVEALTGSAFALDGRGWVAVGLIYKDTTTPAIGYHSDGCCMRVAAASWRLGSPPPALQILSAGVQAEEEDDVINELQIAIGRSALTLTWVVEGGSADSSHFEQAYGLLGSSLHTGKLANGGSETIDLELDHGQPVQSGVADGGAVQVAVGERSGELRQHAGGQRLVPTDTANLGLVSDDEGDTVLWYERELKHGRSLMLATRMAGAVRFAHPRVIANLPPLSGVVVAAGGHRVVVAFWEKGNRLEQLLARRGSAFGAFGATEVISDHADSYEAFVGSTGRTVVVYEEARPDWQAPWELMAATAEPGKPFSRPQRLGHFRGKCQLKTEHGLLTSPTGYAIIPIACEEGGEYIIRYTP